MPKIKPNAWDREGASIKLIVENINKGIDKVHFINLVNQFRTSDYPEGLALSESDIFLLYCKLIENNRNDLVDELRLIEDLVELKEEYTYEVVLKLKYDPNKVWIPQHIELSLVNFCMFHGVDWKDIAYIQQHRKVENTVEMKFTPELVNLNSRGTVSPKQGEPTTEVFATYYPDTFKKYAPYLGMGDAYVDFINNKDGWDEKVSKLYREYPKEVNAYLEYMAQHFTLAILDSSKESKIEDIYKSKKEWLEAYAKALRGMTEAVITLIKNKRSLTQEEKHQSLCETSLKIYLHLIAYKNELHILDEKPYKKLMGFIQSLKANIGKVSPIQAETNTQFFRPVDTSLNASVEEVVSEDNLNVAAPSARRSSI